MNIYRMFDHLENVCSMMGTGTQTMVYIKNKFNCAKNERGQNVKFKFKIKLNHQPLAIENRNN